MSSVIIGAGLSGRGYINRLLYLSMEAVTFLDKDEALIHQLQTQASYTITFGEERTPLTVDNYKAYTINQTEALQAAIQAEHIFISVGANHVQELFPFLQAVVEQRQNPINIIVAENGIAPSTPLASLCENPLVHLSEGIIFCTTLGTKDSLDIASENLDHFPYDSIALKGSLPFYGMVKEEHFAALLERKIYTYNCISACIAYLGYEKGYEVYAEAANDSEIAKKVERIASCINTCITNHYAVSAKEQQEFSEMAIRKFQNPMIVDTIARNVRDVKRKLGEQERIMAPLHLMMQDGITCEELLEVFLAALTYGIKTEELADDITHLITEYAQDFPDSWKTLLSELSRHR